MVAQTINQAKLSGFDFDSLEDDIRANIQIQFAADFNDFTISSLGVLLIDMVSFGLDSLAFYLDRRASDAYLVTARTRASVNKAARQIGYKMGPAVASSVDLNVAPSDTLSVAAPIPIGFQFKGPNGLIFESAEAVTFDVGDGPLDFKVIPAYEGETVTENFVSDGSSIQVFNLSKVPSGKFIVQGLVRLKVDGSDWTESDFITFDATDQFEIGYGDNPPTVTFGDGVAGNIPANTATIQVTYVASRGKGGLVAKNTIEDVVSKLVVGFQVIELDVTNPIGSSGGDDPESLASVKTNAPRVRKANGAAVTGEDYGALANAYSNPLFGRVAVAHAFTPRSAAEDLIVSNALLVIQGVAQDPVPVVATEAANVSMALVASTAALSAITSAVGDITAATAGTSTKLDTAISDARDAKNLSDEVVALTVGIAEQVGAGKAAIDAVATTTSSDRLTAATKTTLKSFFDRVNTVGGTISASAASIKASIETEISDIGEAKDTMATIGLDTTTAGTPTTSITDAVAAVTVQNTVVSTALTNIQTVVVDTDASVVAQVQIINDHMDEILSADCQTNVVVVPILTRDASGFYAAPSLGLISALQDFLTERKEVTQVVQVVSGAPSLVLAQLTILVGVSRGFSESKVKAAVASAIDGLLKGRLFGRSLYRAKDVCDAIDTIPGVGFVNVSIDGHLVDGALDISKLDTAGNLIIVKQEVISKGAVNISSVVTDVT